MKDNKTAYNEHDVLHELKHYLPAQAPLKDFIHHNTLHAFQEMKFYDGLRSASEMFGYKVSLSLKEYREYYKSNKISEEILNKIISQKKGIDQLNAWKHKMIDTNYNTSLNPRIGNLRSGWREQYKMDIDSVVHPLLFRMICSYLDQGIAIWRFPVDHRSFLSSLRELEKNNFTSIFKTKRAKQLLLHSHCEIHHLLKILVGDEKMYKQYLFDQQFAHQGWSGMVCAIEQQPETLLDKKEISLHDLIAFELLLEIDVLDQKLGEKNWEPLCSIIKNHPVDIFDPVPKTELHEVHELWQEAFEWTYYDNVLSALQIVETQKREINDKTFQAFFCIDDRECSIRRHLENSDSKCETYATPGFFGVEFYYKPSGGKFYTKLCPAPVTPKFLIKETAGKTRTIKDKDVHFTNHTHGLFRGWLISQTVGFWSAIRLFINIFKPAMSPATASSFKHMDKFSELTIENKNPDLKENGLQIGFTIEEMANRVEALLRSTGLVKDFAPIVYIIGHGSSSVNNPHFAAYDCGACSGRPGSVNARAASFMANHNKVRSILKERGINIPDETQFIGGLHDTTRDEISFYDEKSLNQKNSLLHSKNELVFNKALDLNAKERSRRFVLIETKEDAAEIHKKIIQRSVSLFEPRPELNHATNALCIIGRRELTKNIFLDRRSFMNSFDYKVDPEGKYLLNILNAAAPVCGGINLEYYFSRVDNQKLGAGTKLPHNVMGLFGVANGIDGDLRPGLPSQMVEVHDPIRLLIIVEHFPDVVLKTIQENPATYQWFINEWVNLAVIDPETKDLFVFENGMFVKYLPQTKAIQQVNNIMPVIETNCDNIPVLILK